MAYIGKSSIYFRRTSPSLKIIPQTHNKTTTQHNMSDTKSLDVPISVEGLLALTWSLNLLVFIFMVLRLWMNHRQSLKAPSIMISDSLLVASFIMGIAAISTDAWKYNLELMGRTRAITPEENKTASLVFHASNNLFICSVLIQWY